MADEVLRANALVKKWGDANEECFELRVPRVTIRSGERWAVMGVSGCGKSTLLAILSLVLPPTEANEYVILSAHGEFDVSEAWRLGDQSTLARARAGLLGYVPQSGGLLPFLTVLENIRLPQRLVGMTDPAKIESLARRLGIEQHLNKKPANLSVGERQRVALARALSHSPKLLVADEPTSALDPPGAENLLALISELVIEYDVAAIVASHDWARMERFQDQTITFEWERVNNSTVSTVLCSDEGSAT